MQTAASSTAAKSFNESHSGLNAAMSTSGRAVDDSHDSERKAADHEALVQKFQLRRVSTRSVSVSKVLSTDVGDGADTTEVSTGNLIAINSLSRRQRAWQAISAPLTPGHLASTCHKLLMLGVNHLQIFYLPFAFTFYPNGSIETVRTGMILQLVHLVDLVLNLNTAFVRKRKLVTSRKEIAQNHITKWFALEVISAIPVSITFGFEDTLPEQVPRILLHYDAVLIALRVFHAAINTQQLLLSYVLRENKKLASWFQYSRYSHLLGIAKLMWLTVLVAHYMACLWHIVAEHQDPVTSIAEQYIADVYYAVQLTQGQGGVTGTWSENLLSTFVILAGSVILAIVFGNVAMLVSNFNANTTIYEQKMQGVFATMNKMGLPLKLRDRVQQYYAHVWLEYGSLGDDIAKFQRELTHILGLEVGLFKYVDRIGTISFWENCSPDFVMQIIRNLGVRVYLPDDYVIRKGEIGDEMFMINRGICILSDNMEIHDWDPVGDSGAPQRRAKPWWGKGKDTRARVRPEIHRRKSNYEIDSDQERVWSTDQLLLYPGGAFGELSLLMNYKRTANIQAVTYVETCTLDRSTFQRIISRYHDDRKTVLTSILKNCVEKKTRSSVSS